MHQQLNLSDIIEWDIPNWALSLEYWPEHSQLQTTSCHALEIGCSNGGISLWAALQGMHVVCSDLNGPSKIAINKHQKHQVSEQIRYEAINALDIPYKQTFDLVLFKSVLGGIGGINGRDNPDYQKKVFAEIHKSLKQGGEVWFAENLMASPLHQFCRRNYIRWAKEWRYLTIEEMHNYLSIFSEVHYMTLGFLATFGRTPWQRTLLGKLDRLIVDQLVPQSWHYIMIGVARK